MSLENVHPVLAAKALKIIDLAKADGHTLIVTQGFRSFAEQDKLYNKRPRVTRARGGQSYHNYGLAVDFAFTVNGKLDWTDSLYRKIGKWAAAVGLEWGGNWTSFKDLPHVQFPNMPSNANHLLQLYRQKGIAAVWLRFK